MDKLAQARAKLKEVFGYASFRPGQERVIAAVLSGKDVLAVMPTGAGKSLCYQIPGLVLSGVTLVVSPLISLMQDQVGALLQSGVRAAYINSMLTQTQVQKALTNASAGVYKIIYVAPERLLTESFLRFAMNAEIAQVVVDEAHCVSQWGQDFRPGYLQIAEFIRMLPVRPPVCAFTATATDTVRADIRRLLELRAPYEMQTGFDRANLRFEVRREKDRDAALLGFLNEQRGNSGIVYCGTRKAVEAVAGFLRQNGFNAAGYHAGLNENLRKQTQEDFVSDRIPIIVATNAFGMGIDKSNVSFVVHYNMPKDLESYYQEAGRAGRDGEDAVCVLLYSGSDIRLNTFLIEHSMDASELDDETRKVVLERARERLRHMIRYATTSGCLRGKILTYFGDKDIPKNCGNCSFCLSEGEERDVTREAAQAVACVVSMGGRYGRGVTAAVLSGKADEKIRKAELHRLALFGCLKAFGTDNCLLLLDELVMNGALEQTEGQYPLLKAGPGARDLLRGDEPVRMRLASASERSTGAKPSGRRKDRTEMGIDERLFKRLAEVRKRIADEQHVPAFIIFTNATLRDMVNKRPHTRSEMSRVAGVGQGKLERYGARFLTAIHAYEEE